MTPAELSPTRPTLYLGIDPGASGAAAWIGEDGSFADWFLFAGESTATIAGRILRERVIFAVLEKVAAMPGQGVSSMFSFGESYGRIQGILAAKLVPYALVQPQGWRKAVGLQLPAKRDGQDRAARSREVKQATVDAAVRRWPETAELFSKKKNWPVADALFLAECARLTRYITWKEVES